MISICVAIAAETGAGNLCGPSVNGDESPGLGKIDEWPTLIKRMTGRRETPLTLVRDVVGLLHSGPVSRR